MEEIYEPDSQAFVEDQRDEQVKEFETAVLRHIETDYQAAKTARNAGGREEDWDRFYAKYLCEARAGKLPWQSKVVDPEPYAAVETVWPRIVNTMLAGPEIFGLKPTGQEDVEKSRKSTVLLNHQADRMNLFEKLGDSGKEGLYNGTALGMVYWRQEHEPRITKHPVLDEMGHPVPNPMTGQPLMQPEKEFVLTYDDPQVDRVDIKSLYVDPNASCVQDARYIIHETERTLDYLKKKEVEGVYFNIDKIPKNDSTSGTSDDARRAANKEPSDPSIIEVHDKAMEFVKLRSYYGQYDIDGDGYLEEALIVVANGTTVIRFDYNPFPGGFKPFYRFTPIPIPGSFYGMSLYKAIDTLTDALDDRINQVGDSIKLLLNPMYKINRHAGIDPDDLVSQPGGAIRMNQMTDMERLDSHDIIASVFPEMGRMEQKIQKATGVYDYAAGGAPQRQEAATTVISLQNVAEIRFKTMTILFERQVIRPLGNMMLRLNKEYMGPERQVRVLGRRALADFQGDEFEKVTPQDIVTDPDIYAVGAAIDPSVSKQFQLENLMTFLTIVGNNPAVSMNPLFSINYPAIIEALPYLLSLEKTVTQPLIMPGNPMVAYQEIQEDQKMADGALMQQMGALGQMAAAEEGVEKTEKEAPSRVKGERAKSTSNKRRKKSESRAAK